MEGLEAGWPAVVRCETGGMAVFLLQAAFPGCLSLVTWHHAPGICPVYCISSLLDFELLVGKNEPVKLKTPLRGQSSRGVAISVYMNLS